MTPVVLIVLLCGAATRVTRLLVADSFPPVAALRDWVLDRWHPDSWQAYLSSCPWCLGVWVAGALTAAADWRYSVPAPLLMWPTVAWVAGWLTTEAERHDEPDAEPQQPPGAAAWRQLHEGP